jgi:hypothetical protein
VSAPPDPAPDPWPEPGAFEANAGGHLTYGQRRMLLGGPTPPPYASLSIIGVAAMAGAVLWWRFGLGAGITVILVGSNIGLAVMGMNLDRRRRRRRLRSDLDHPRIDRGIGEVAAAGAGVDIRSGPGRIDLGLDAPAAPPPGWYEMHWLAHPGAQRWDAGRVLLSARPVRQPPPPGGDREYPGSRAGPVVAAEVRARLRQVLGRTEWELGFNRYGQLSPPQRHELHRRARRRAWARSVGAVVGTLVAVLMFVSAILAWRRPPAEDPDARAAGFISAGMGLIALWITVRVVLGLPAAVAAVRRPPPLGWASGPVVATLVDSENDTWTVAVEGGPPLQVTADVARAFRTPVRYTVYYALLGRDHVLLAAEPDPADGDGAEVGAARGWPRPDWVAANAAGRLTQAQQGQVVGGRVGLRSTYLLLTPVLIVVVGTAVPYIVHRFRPRRIVVDDGTELAVTLSVAAVVVAAWAASMLWYASTRRRRAAAVRAPRIVVSTGEIVWAGGRYRISGTPVPLRLPAGHDTTPEPGPYRFYWLPVPRPTLLSAEPRHPGPWSSTSAVDDPSAFA